MSRGSILIGTSIWSPVTPQLLPRRMALVLDP
jgi:hypothetical protein